MKHVEDAHTNHFQEEEGTSNPLCECVWGGGIYFILKLSPPACSSLSLSPHITPFPLPTLLLRFSSLSLSPCHSFPSLPSLTSLQSCPLYLLSMLLIFPTHLSSFPLSSAAPPPLSPWLFPLSPFPFPLSPFPFPISPSLLYCFPHTPARFEER